MRMKSILALSAFSIATLFGNIGYSADQPTPPKVKQAKQTKPAKSAKQTEKMQQSNELDQSVSTDQPEPKHRARKHHRHHRHHRHKHHHHFHPRYSHLEGYRYRELYPIHHYAPCSNFLLGGSLAYGSQKENLLTQYTAPSIIPTAMYSDQSERITDAGVLMGILAGWQWRCHRWLLGIEGSVDFESFEKDRQFVYADQIIGLNRFYGTALYDRGDIFGLTTRVGYFVTSFFMPYLRLGVQVSRDEVSYQIFAGPPPIRLPDYSSKKKDVYGIVAGVGAEFPTYIGGSTIRFEYNFTRTESVIIEDNTLPVVGNHKFRYPESHIGKVSWVWNFL